MSPKLGGVGPEGRDGAEGDHRKIRKKREEAERIGGLEGGRGGDRGEGDEGRLIIADIIRSSTTETIGLAAFPPDAIVHLHENLPETGVDALTEADDIWP